jgi:hypothetical protein
MNNTTTKIKPPPISRIFDCFAAGGAGGAGGGGGGGGVALLPLPLFKKPVIIGVAAVKIGINGNGIILHIYDKNICIAWWNKV